MPKLQTNGAKQKRTTYMILLLWAAACFALLVVDWCCWAPNRLDADMASEQLLANLLAQEGGVMSTNWYYSTELRVLNTQLVMAPLFRQFPSWHTVRVVGSVVLILLYLAAWFWFGHSAKLKYSGLLGAGLLVLPYGALYRQYVLEGLYYIPHIANSFEVMGCAVRILRGGRILNCQTGVDPTRAVNGDCGGDRWGQGRTKSPLALHCLLTMSCSYYKRRPRGHLQAIFELLGWGRRRKKIGQNRSHDPAPQTRGFLTGSIIPGFSVLSLTQVSSVSYSE